MNALRVGPPSPRPHCRWNKRMRSVPLAQSQLRRSGIFVETTRPTEPAKPRRGGIIRTIPLLRSLGASISTTTGISSLRDFDFGLSMIQWQRTLKRAHLFIVVSGTGSALTPALSPRRGSETIATMTVESVAAPVAPQTRPGRSHCSNAASALPLPGGEGRGEGERSHLSLLTTVKRCVPLKLLLQERVGVRVVVRSLAPASFP